MTKTNRLGCHLACAILLSFTAIACAADATPLSERLLSSNSSVAIAALVELGRKGAHSQQELEMARSRIADGNASVRLAAIGAASRLHDDGAIPMIILSMRAADPAAASELGAALTALTGHNIGGADASVWAAWHEEVVKSTTASIAALQAASAKGDSNAVRAAIHPLLMQRAGRDQVVGALSDLVQSSSSPRIAALAREGLVTLNTAAAQIAIAAIKPDARPASTRSTSSPVDKPTVGKSGPTTTGVIDLPEKPNPWLSKGSLILLGCLVGLIGLTAVAIIYGKRWLAKHPKIEQMTRMFVLKSRRIKRN
ncbi:MAG: hypothetical protein AAB263_01720 [Planctomycetota bacterium]